MTDASALVFDQKLEGNTVKLAYVYVPKKSLVVIYDAAAKDGARGDARGSLALQPGDHRDVKIPLSAAPKAGDTLAVALYEDNDADGKFTAKSDLPYWKAGERPTESNFVVR